MTWRYLTRQASPRLINWMSTPKKKNNYRSSAKGVFQWYLIMDAESIQWVYFLTNKYTI